MKKLKVAILGQGRSGRDIHGVNLQHLKDKYQITAIVEPLEKRRERAKKEHDCAVYTYYRELFGQSNEIDLIINATPSHLHAPVTLDLLKNGFNVLCEKPFAKTAEEIDVMIAAAKKNNKLLAVFQQSRFGEAYREIKRIINSGILGRIIQISMCYNGFARRWDWQTLQEYNAGSLYNTGPHPVDQLLQLLDYDGMPEVKCYMNRVNTFGDAEDYVKLIMTAPDKPVIDLEISSCNPYPKFQYSVQAEYGGLCGDNSHLDYKYYVRETAPEQHLTRTPIENPDGTPAYCNEKLEWVEKSWDISDVAPRSEASYVPGAPPQEPAIAFYEMLYNHIVNNAPLEVTPQQVRQQIAVMEECHRQNPMSRIKS
ncbi:MAG: Gfo/Idh/MocA family oxidoreductase [Oscillospiraceae bacterium]|nr:Gfo/Idh/MocA family oxidoreductase [Oscillospiraceae bacterium]